MAEGWARHLWDDRITPWSAGIENHGLNPRAVAVMAEAGVEISAQRSKHLDALRDMRFDLVVPVCDHAYESCPVLAAPRIVHRAFDDPPRLSQDARSEDETLGIYRRVRDEIRDFVQSIPLTLLDRDEPRTSFRKGGC
jgi:arsenate reductase